MLEGNLNNTFLSSNETKESFHTYFTLKKNNSSSSSPCISVNFSSTQLNSQSGTLSSTNLIPTFNRDHKFYTPSFILSNEQMKYVQNDEAYRMIHERKIKDIDEEKNQIFVPKPSKTNSYCCICKVAFEDYLTHVNIPKHKQLMRKSIYCKFIQEICGIFDHKNLFDSEQTTISQKTEKKIPFKIKKIIKVVTDQPKRGRGRPRKNISKLQSLASIPTTISISV